MPDPANLRPDNRLRYHDTAVLAIEHFRRRGFCIPQRGFSMHHPAGSVNRGGCRDLRHKN